MLPPLLSHGVRLRKAASAARERAPTGNRPRLHSGLGLRVSVTEKRNLSAVDSAAPSMSSLRQPARDSKCQPGEPGTVKFGYRVP